MADQNKIKKDSNKDESITKENQDSVKIALSQSSIEIFEEVIEEESATLLYKILSSPKINQEREKLIEESIELFPEPEKPRELELDI